MEIAKSSAYRVNGAFLSNFIGKQVVVIGTVLKVDPSGRSFELKTSDDRVVTVNLNEPMSCTLKGIVEVHGEGTSKNVIRGDSYYEFTNELTEKFDLETYNECINVMNTISNPWKS